MKRVLFILALALVCISASVATSKILAVPATPQRVKHDWFNSVEQADEFIGECAREGYIIKSVSVVGHPYGFQTWLVVAEKY